MLNSPVPQRLQTYVTFNFQTKVTDDSKRKLDRLNSSWAPSFPHSYVSTPYLKQEYHVTLGESIYCEKNTDEQKEHFKVKKVDVTDKNVVTHVRDDHQKMLTEISRQLLNAQAHSLTGYVITSFKISDRGFIFATMRSDANAVRIANSFKNSTLKISSTNSDVNIGLKEFYQPSDPFNMHVSIGRIQLPPKTKLTTEEKAEYQSKLDNDYLLNAYKNQAIYFEGNATLSATFLNAKQERERIAQATLSLPPENDISEDMARLTLQEKPKTVLLHQFPALQDQQNQGLRQIAQQQKPTPHLDCVTNPSVDDIKSAIAIFFPERASLDIKTDVFVKLSDKSQSGMYEIGFHSSENDRRAFCEKFKRHFAGARGLCHYSTLSKKYVVMDEAAIRTLLNFTEQLNANKSAPIKRACL